MLILVLIHQQLQLLQQLLQLAVNFLIILAMTIVMMETIMKIVNGMEETVVEVMLTQIIAHLVNV